MIMETGLPYGLTSQLFFLDISTLFSGLNLGIMTLDVMHLEVLIEAGTNSEKKMATAVLPVRRRGNLTICSLTTANEHLGYVHKDEMNIITGALNLDQRTAKGIMTPIEQVFMLPDSALLDFETLNEIMTSGFTRIPIYKNDRRNVTSVLNVKDLAFTDPKEKLPVSTICNFYNRPFIYVAGNTNLKALFDKFRKESIHLAVVYEEHDPEQRKIIGIVTMEDVIEEIIQDEIYDETDVINSDDGQTRKRRSRMQTTDLWPFFNHLGDGKISPQLKIAALRYLVANTTYFAPQYVHTSVLQGYLNTAFAVQHDYNHLSPEENNLYKSGVPSQTATLVLQGTLTVSVHNDRLQFEAGAFMIFGDDIFASELPTLLVSVIVKALFQAILYFLQGVNEEFPSFSGEWDLEKILEELGDKKSFLPDYNVKMNTDLRSLEFSAEAYIVLRYLTQELEKCSITDQNHRQLVDLFYRFWRLRHHRGLRLVCEGDGIRIIEPPQQTRMMEISTEPTSDGIPPSNIFDSLRSSPIGERGNSPTTEGMGEDSRQQNRES
ncbi:hypothetical protein Aperf_G00000027297 [Anoplocephala perfoliata]